MEATPLAAIGGSELLSRPEAVEAVAGLPELALVK